MDGRFARSPYQGNLTGAAPDRRGARWPPDTGRPHLLGDVELYYQSGRDPAHDRDSVGFVLLCHTIRTALEDGVEAYWFLRGDEAYKGRFAEEDPGLQTTTVACSLRGGAAVAGARIFDRLPSPARRWLTARMG